LHGRYPRRIGGAQAVHANTAAEIDVELSK